MLCCCAHPKNRYWLCKLIIDFSSEIPKSIKQVLFYVLPLHHTGWPILRRDSNPDPLFDRKNIKVCWKEPNGQNWMREAGFEPATFGLWAQRATRLLHSAVNYYVVDFFRAGADFFLYSAPASQSAAAMWSLLVCGDVILKIPLTSHCPFTDCFM